MMFFLDSGTMALCLYVQKCTGIYVYLFLLCVYLFIHCNMCTYVYYAPHI